MKRRIQTPGIAFLMALSILIFIYATPISGAETYRFRDLGNLGSELSIGYGINNAGDIVGRSYPDCPSPAGDHAAMWRNGVWIDLGTLGGFESQAWDITNAGHVVGQAQNADHRMRAFYYDGATMGEIHPFDSWYSTAYGASDSGYVAG